MKAVRFAVVTILGLAALGSSILGGVVTPTTVSTGSEPTRPMGATGLGPVSGPPVEFLGSLSPYAVHNGTIDYVAAGAAMRNQGYGTITVNWTGTLVAGYLVWAFMSETAPTSGTLNGVPITGNVVASTSINPCWTGTIYTLLADVTSVVVNGTNSLTGFPSGLTAGQDPWASPLALPLFEGASLIVVFDSGGPWRQITLYVAAETIRTVNTTLTDTLTHAAAISNSEKTTFIVSDGQDPGNTAIWKDTVVDANAFPGADPRTSTAPWTLGNLWDTRTYEGALPGPIPSSSETVGISNVGTPGDCLTWNAQVLRVDTAHDDPPIAVARASPTAAAMGDMITFDASASTDDLGIADYQWDFGDGTGASGMMAPHWYGARGSFEVALTVWDTSDQSDVDTVMIDIENRPPLADAGRDQGGLKNFLITLDGTKSSDADGDPLTYSWLQTAGPPVVLARADTAMPTYTPSASGVYAFSLVVADGWGGSSSDAVIVTVTNRAPIADAGADRALAKRTFVTLDGRGSSDPDGDALVFSWAQLSGPPVDLAGADTAAPMFTAARGGAYSFRLHVDDNDGGTSEDVVAVRVWGLPPAADLVATPQRAGVGTTIVLDGTRSSDPDGAIVDFAFAFGDGTGTSGAAAMRDHVYAAPGSYTVRLTVTDDDGNVSTAFVVLEVTEAFASPPVVMNWKPFVAVVFAGILALVGAMSARGVPWPTGTSRRLRAFGITALPFVAMEAATGVVSLFTGLLAIPPLLGVGTAVDLIILMAGVGVSSYRVLTR